MAGAQTPPADQDIPGGHFYTQANGMSGNTQYGYRIYDDASAKFWTEFQRLGGVTALGYPSSLRFQMDGFTVQATQKVILQWRPEVNQAYFVNVFDKLHDSNQDAALQSQFGIPAQLPTSFDAGKTPDQVQASRIALLDADAAIKGTYNANSNPVLYYGLPTSNVTPGAPFNMLRAQRVAIQHWNTAGPGGIKPGDVSIVNGGDVAKTLGLVTAAAQITETSSGQPSASPPSGPTPTPVAGSTPTPTTSGFTYRSKAVTDPPVDCNADSTRSSIPCVSVAGNGTVQFIKGRVMDQNGSHLRFVSVRATVTGGANLTQNVQTEGDGTFAFYIAGGPPGIPSAFSSNCPSSSVQYQIMVTSNTGAQDSDIHTINYDGNCNSDGEFHFDFVKTR